MISKINNILDLPFYADDNYSERNSHKIKKEGPVSIKTFKETALAVRELAVGFAYYGIKPGDHIGFFVNNRFEWIVTDFAIMALRAVSVPRGSDTTPHEVQFIFNHSDSSFLILEDVSQLIKHDKIYAVLMKEVSSLISREHGFKPFERISRILPVINNFSVGKELTQTMKVKRKYIVEKYKNLIDKLHRDTRN